MTFRAFLQRFLAVFVIILLAVGAWQARATLLMGFAAVLIAVGISIPTTWLQRIGVRRPWAIAVATFGVGLGFIFLILLVMPRLFNELLVLLSSIPDALRALLAVYTRLRESNQFLNAALAPLPSAENVIADFTPERAQEILNQFLNAGVAIAPTLLGGVESILSVLISFVLVLFIAIFFLVDPQSYIKASLYLLPAHHHRRAMEVWKELYATLRAWITALSLSISITVALVWLILGVVLGLPNSLVVAVFAGLATFIPNIGAFLPIIPITIFTLTSEPSNLLLYIPVYLAIQLTESNIITPAIVKAELEVPSGGLLIFQLLMTLAFGALGLLLAVPMLALVIVLVRELYVYDQLGLRNTVVELEITDQGHLQLHEQHGVDTTDVEAPLKSTAGRTNPVANAQSSTGQQSLAPTKGSKKSR